MNIVSALYPAFHWRYLLLRDMFSVRVINDSQIWTVLLGIVLILLADALAKRNRRAMRLTLGLLVMSAILHLTKGLDYEEALVCLGIAAVLFVRRDDYSVPSRPFTLRTTVTSILSFVLLFCVYDLLGFRILSRWISPKPTLSGALLEPLRLLTDEPVYRYHGYQAHWFGTSLMLVGAAALVYSAFLVLRPLLPIHLSNAVERDQAKRVIQKYGQDTLSYFALREDRAYFFTEERDAVLSYKVWWNVALVGGDPIGPASRIEPLLQDFMDFCRQEGLSICFLGVNDQNLHLYQRMGLRVVKIGEESIIRLPEFDASKLKRKVRRAERHCVELGIVSEMFTPADLPVSYRDQAMEISKAWVKAKGGAERGFSMTLGRLPREDDVDTRVMVAREGERILAFLTFVPVFGSRGWSLDMMRRRMDTPNGLTEFTVIQAARTLGEQGFEYMSLNFASLSCTQNTIPEPRVLSSLRRFLFHNLSSVYQLKSLYLFNAKFDPEWSSRYLVYGDLMRAPKIIMAVVQAEDPIKVSTVASVFKR
jgi:phosphatidylglycerol lysyltransferase